MIGRILAAAMLAAMFVTGAQAQDAAPLEARAEQVLLMLNDEGDLPSLFTPAFLAQVPPAQLQSVAAQLRAQHGAARSVVRVEPRTPHSAVVRIAAERAILVMEMALEPDPPHRISGLLVTGTEVAGDTLPRIAEEVAALPGETAFLVAKLGESGPQSLAAHRAESPMAIGSTFKLYVLGALQRQIAAGERRWDEVVTLDRKSLPSGTLQNWPSRAPLTLHSLATLMISISDNTATDLLIHKVGRENVERFVGEMSPESAALNRPFLTTMEAFSIKSAPEAAWQQWRDADEATRRRLLASLHAAATPESVDPRRFGPQPVRIDVEWFASPRDVAALLDWMRREGGDEVHAILAVAPGVPAASRGDYRYLGFKGGSEGGVINLSWLVQSQQGQWHVVTGSWNNPEGPVEEARFLGLVQRALQLVR